MEIAWERVKFEKFAVKLDILLGRTETGLYKHPITQACWVCWQQSIRDYLKDHPKT